jgi:hypothetical protein
MMTRQNLLRAASVLAMCVAAFAVQAKPSHADWRSLTAGSAAAFDAITSFRISPDSRHVVFKARRVGSSADELYTTPITGSTPITLNLPLVANGAVRTYGITPDSRYVIYIADQEVDERQDLYRVPVEGGQPVKLNEALAIGGNVMSFKIDPDNQRVVYEADQQTNEKYELWSVPIAGGANVKLNGEFTQSGDLGIFSLDRISDRVVYSADQEVDGKYELFSVPIAGGSALKLNPPITLAGGGDSGLYSEFSVNPIVPVVVFIAREGGSNIGRLYMIPTAGGELTPLSFTLLNTQRLQGFRVSPLGDRVVFNVLTRPTGSTAVLGGGSLHSVLIGGGGLVNLTEPADAGYGVRDYDFQFTANGSHVIYQYQKTAASAMRFESSTVGGGVRAVLYQPGTSEPAFRYSRSSPNGQWVLFQTGTSNASPLFTLPPSGGGATQLSVAEFQEFTPDSNRVLYTRVISQATGQNALYSAQVFGGDERNLSGSDSVGRVFDAAVSNDGKWVVYIFNDSNTTDLRVSDGRPAQAGTPTPQPTQVGTQTPPAAAFRVRMPLVGRN